MADKKKIEKKVNEKPEVKSVKKSSYSKKKKIKKNIVNGIAFVLSTIASIFLSKISLTIHPADLIRTAPQKNKKQCSK